MNNSTDSVSDLISRFLNENDFSANTRRAFAYDIRSFAEWFAISNEEPFSIGRMTTADITGFKDYLWKQRGKSISTVNRVLVSLRRWCSWLVEEELLGANPCRKVKEIKRQQLSPKV
jgi:integrase/recombinase XerD